MFTIYMSANRVNYGIIGEVFSDDIRHTLICGFILFYLENRYITLIFLTGDKPPPSLMDLIPIMKKYDHPINHRVRNIEPNEASS